MWTTATGSISRRKCFRTPALASCSFDTLFVRAVNIIWTVLDATSSQNTHINKPIILPRFHPALRDSKPSAAEAYNYRSQNKYQIVCCLEG